MSVLKKQIVTVAGLKKQAATYDTSLRVLPFFSLRDFAASLKLNILEIDNEHVIVSKRRKAGATGPYSAGMTIKYQEELMKYRESSLKPELTVAKTRDNVTNYKDVNVMYMGGKPLDEKTKSHPLEKQIVEDMIKSHGEDVVFSAFHAERNELVDSPMTSFNGFNTKIDMLIAADEINAAKGNFSLSGGFNMPVSDTDYSAYENLVEWIGGAHTLLRSSNGGVPQLLCAENVLTSARAGLRKKLRMFEYPTMTQMIEKLREDSMCPSLLISTHEALGVGSKLILQKVGNMDLGFNTGKSQQFVQVRDIFEDPNEVQFWLEAAYDTRIRDVHGKVFRTNEQSNASLDLAGDYVNVGAAMCSITGADGKWRVKGHTSWKDSGTYTIALLPGEATIEFMPVAGFVSPAEQKVVIKESEVTQVTGVYTK